MTYKYATLFKWINVIIDYFMLNAALYASFLVDSRYDFWATGTEHYRLDFLLLNLFWFYSSSLVRLYERVMVRDAMPTLTASAKAFVISMLMPLVVILLLPNYNLAPDFLIRAYIFFGLCLVIWKFSFLFVRKHRRKYWVKHQRVVIIGASSVGKELYQFIENSPDMGYKIEGIFDDAPEVATHENIRILGRVEDCFTYVLANGITEVFSALPLQHLDKAKQLMQQADKHMIRFRLVPDVKAYFDRNVLLEQYGDLAILTPRREPLDNKANEIIKRAFDIFFSLMVILFVLSWLVPLIGLLIKLDSPGPVFFRQLRSGKGNKPFYCYKFRSMRVNAEADTRQASKGDSRITPIGAFLRKTSIDELPQFFNVLKGEMSVVGPRPHMIKHTQDFSLLIDKFMVRHFLTPGITGWAQVNGYRGETHEPTDVSKRVDADLWYLENWTLLLDLKIICLTVWRTLRGDMNAY